MAQTLKDVVDEIKREQNKSTGPRTPEGKRKSAQNSLKHGLTSGQVFIAGEDPEEFQALREGLHFDYNPVGPSEVMLVESMARFQWFVQRAMLIQDRTLIEEEDEVIERRLALFMRYQNTNHLAFHRTLKTLLEQQTKRLAAEKLARESVSQNEKSPQTPAPARAPFTPTEPQKSASEVCFAISPAAEIPEKEPLTPEFDEN